eukprot:CAMPEP_0180667762 /NCGR_PEP_ID=MMETSP1037_2-20121125/62555_1 /TAXON_ID=632150 /ORGANISM="Azadinium spinosum, Strain 3D9" /LENGTH=163 /DNA_ID=CAMNT_0022696427 /DNA_START=51 /DNA_END=539 /DNA_ORIENTATION=+
MRAKEKAVQDLVHRNRTLLDTSQKLDGENQVLSERLKELEATERAAVATSVPAPPPPSRTPPEAASVVPKATVDDSVFAKLERGKEERIIMLKKENERLAAQVRRLHEGGQRLEEALVQAQKELKKVQKDQGKSRSGGGVVESAPQAHLDQKVLEEEERIYRE